jgi:hypothetical protein
VNGEKVLFSGKEAVGAVLRERFTGAKREVKAKKE